MADHGKKYREVAKLVDRTRAYPPEEALDLAKETSFTKFDATVEVHVRLGVDPRHADQMVRGIALLPAGTGKSVRVAVFAQGDKAREAEEAGADIVGADDLIKQVEGGQLDFDVSIATPDIMGKVGKLGKILGPRGLMPNPKAGTVTFEIAKAINEIRAGRVEFRVDKTSLLHAPIGKVSFSKEQLNENLNAFLDAVVKAKPSGARGTYVRNVVLSTSMGPGIKVDVPVALAGANSG